MSKFTKVKVRINNKERMSTLLAEYGGNYEIKIWILDTDSAWTGELSSTEAQVFITNFTLTEKIFIDELQKALTLSDHEVKYSIEKNESDGYIFSWKRGLDTGIAVKMGEMRIVEVTLKEAYEEIFDRCFENNSLMRSQINSLNKERNTLLTEKNEVLSSFEKAVEQKKTFEQTVYCQFLAVLNAKKEKIRELEAELDRITESRGSTTKVYKTAESRKKPMTKKERIKPESVSDEVAKGDVGPYDVDTEVDTDDNDTDSDLINDKLKKGTASRLRSQSSDLFDSFEEVPSPVAVLPKRSRLNPKETVKRNIDTDKAAPCQDMDDDDLLHLL